ncbi:MAG TPA: ATP-binding cassette domain-containing protein, partial [Nitrolancea sp.]|nr:ATP-binding cassette domain-containing protein [Nitrolancea sp.]
PMGTRTDLPAVLTLAVEQVSVRPPGHSPILEDASLVIRPGERVAVTGATGSGKSTLLSLLPGLIEPTAGRVTLGGVDVHEFDPVILRSAVAAVPEDALLFEDSVRANLTLGCPEASDEDLWEALRIAGVANLVAALPQGLESLLGRGGREVSGGEAQRVCLARALVRHPAILVLDDALSAVDQPTERRIVRNLEQWPGTIVFTSNRPIMLGLATRRVRITEHRLCDDLVAVGAGDNGARMEPARGVVKSGYVHDEGREEPGRSTAALTSGTVVQGTLRRAWPMIRPFATAVGISALLSILGTVCVLIGPRIIERVVDHGILGGDTSLLAPLALLYFALALGAALFHYGFVALSSAVGESALHVLRLRTWESLHRQPLAFFEKGRTGELVSRATDDIQELASFFRNSFETVVTAIILLALGLVFMFVLSPWLTLAALALIPISIVSLGWYLRHSPAVYAEQLQANAETVNAINQTIGGVTAIHAAGDFRYGLARARQAYVAYLASSRKVIDFENRAFFPVESVNGAVLGCVVAAGIGLTQAGLTTAGLVVAFIVYVDALVQPLTLIADLVGETQKARVALARLLGIQELPGEAESPDVPLPLPSRGTLEVHGASFGYRSGRPVLRGVNLRMQPGTRVTIVGPSGVGKSTLAKLLSGLEQPSSGYVALGGIDLLAASPADRRRAVTLISQGSQLFDGTIADNLRLARPDVSNEEMWSAAERLGLHTMFERFPNGLETPVGRQGALLSAGERQLVALVRLALHDPALIVLDESTSRVDDAMEREIHACLERLAADRALVVIAHRPATIARSDQVLTLRDGQLAPLDAVNV